MMSYAVLHFLGNSFRRVVVPIFISVLAAVRPVAAGPGVTLIWDRSLDPTVMGYRLYCGDLSGGHTNRMDLGDTNWMTLTNLAETRTYTFFVTAYAAGDVESEPSNTLEFTMPLGAVETILARGPDGNVQMRLRMNAVEGRRLALETSTDLATWVTVQTTDAVGEALEFVPGVTPGEAKRFFRGVTVE